jgi:hypothetical protein
MIKGIGSMKEAGPLPTNEFALNNRHIIDFALKLCCFSRVWPQGFVFLWPKPCNFGSSHEAPSAP